HLLNIIDAVLASAAIKAISVDRNFLLCSFAPLTPHKSPIKYLIDVAELADRRVECVAGNRQYLVGFAEQLGRNVLSSDLQHELTIEEIAVSDAPDTDAFAARSYFLIGINRGLQIVLRPHVDRVGDGTAAVIKIDRSERIIFG